MQLFSQNRYAYYYSVNVSVLSAYVGGLLLEKVKWNELDKKFKANVKSYADIPSFLKFMRSRTSRCSPGDISYLSLSGIWICTATGNWLH